MCNRQMSRYDRERLKKYRMKRYHEQNGLCCFCGCKMILFKGKKWRRYKQYRATTEHVVPYSHGGSNEYENIVASCHECNLHRGTMPFDEWKAIASDPVKLAQFHYQRRLNRQRIKVERQQAQMKHFFALVMLLNAIARGHALRQIVTAYQWVSETQTNVD